MISSYPFTLESQRRNLLLFRRGVLRSAVGQGLPWSAVGQEVPPMNGASGLYTH